MKSHVSAGQQRKKWRRKVEIPQLLGKFLAASTNNPPLQALLGLVSSLEPQTEPSVVKFKSHRCHVFASEKRASASSNNLEEAFYTRRAIGLLFSIVSSTFLFWCLKPLSRRSDTYHQSN